MGGPTRAVGSSSRGDFKDARERAVVNGLSYPRKTEIAGHRGIGHSASVFRSSETHLCEIYSCSSNWQTSLGEDSPNPVNFQHAADHGKGSPNHDATYDRHEE